MQVLVAAVLPLLISAFGSAVGKSLSAFNAMPRDARRAKLESVLRSKWMLAGTPAGALAARQVAKSPAALDMLIDALESHGGSVVAAGTGAAQAAATKRLPTSNPRSGGRMARVRSFPSIPTLALDRLDVTRARRNGKKPADPYVFVEGKAPDGSYFGANYKKSQLKALYAALLDAGVRHVTLDEKEHVDLSAHAPRRNGYRTRRNCGGDCACAPCQSARMNPSTQTVWNVSGSPTDRQLGRMFPTGWTRLSDGRVATLASYANKVRGVSAHVVGTATLAEVVQKQVNPRNARRNTMQAFAEHDRKEAEYLARLRTLAAAFRELPYSYDAADIERIIEHSKRGSFGLVALRALVERYEKALAAEQAAYQRDTKQNPRSARRNHHIRVGGTFYTPGGRKGTVLAEARGGHYRVRWSDGTLGTVQDSEMAAYPTAGSRANGARKNGRRK